MKFDTKLEPSGRDSPYPGPHPFDTSDQDFFFGRDAERDALKALWLETMSWSYMGPRVAARPRCSAQD